MMTSTAAPPIVQAPTQGTNPIHLYALEILRHIAAHGCHAVSLDQLRIADRFYPLLVWRLEGKQDPKDKPKPEPSATAERFADMQRMITRTIAYREKAIAEWFSQFGSLDDHDSATAPSGAADLDTAADEPPPMDPKEQAIRMLRAALQMIQDPGTTDTGGGGGGSRVPVTPRSPRMPPGGAAARPQDNNAPRPDIRPRDPGIEF